MNCQYSLLEDDALLHIVGPDTLKFLQGQTSCDTRDVDSNHALPGVFCTPQGRVICDFLLAELGPEHFALRMRRDIRAGSGAAFGKYIVFSKAELDASREDWSAIGVWGVEAAKALTEVFGELPGGRFGATCGEGFVLVQSDEQGQQFECFLQSTRAQKYLTGMDTVIRTGTESAWQAVQISAGIARIELPTVEEFVPQTLNYDLTGHISFKKGCYTGQEVVARLHYRGKPKRRTYVAQLDKEIPCTAGTGLFNAGSDQAVGSVVNSSTLDGKTLLLASATATGVANGLRLGSGDGALLTINELPYALQDE